MVQCRQWAPFDKPPNHPSTSLNSKSQDTMKLSSLVLVTLGALSPLATAGIVITPIGEDQTVDKMSGDCFFGVVTPQGCGCVFFCPVPSPAWALWA